MSRDQRAVYFAPRAARRPVALLPFDDARSPTQIRALVTSGNCIGRSSGGLPSAARRRALRSGCVSLCASLRLRSTFPARRPQTEARSEPIGY
jgi:hypothetical protein